MLTFCLFEFFFQVDKVVEKMKNKKIKKIKRQKIEIEENMVTPMPLGFTCEKFRKIQIIPLKAFSTQ